MVGGDNKSFAARGEVLVTKNRFRGGKSSRSLVCGAAKASCERGSVSFCGERRQAAELARMGHMARFICARMEMRTHHAFMVGLRAKFVTLSCPPA